MRTPREHQHVCARCHWVYACTGTYVMAEDADGRPRAVCGLWWQLGMDMCGPCEKLMNGKGLGPNGWAQ